MTYSCSLMTNEIVTQKPTLRLYPQRQNLRRDLSTISIVSIIWPFISDTAFFKNAFFLSSQWNIYILINVYNQFLYFIMVSIKITLSCLNIPKLLMSFKKHSKIPLLCHTSYDLLHIKIPKCISK